MRETHEEGPRGDGEGEPARASGPLADGASGGTSTPAGGAWIEEAVLLAEVARARDAGLYKDARSVIRWAFELLGGRLMMTTSFQKSGMIILHLVKEVAPSIPVYFLDTGFHFAESLEFAQRIKDIWGIRLILQRPRLFGDDFHAIHGKLHERDPELCCQLNKVEPQRELLERYQGWIAGVRRDQAATRAGAESLEVLEGGKLKVQPLAYWERSEVDAYLQEHEIPTHPLFERGYTSIGCAPCTLPNNDPLNERAGRWIGKAKVECGLHTFWKARGKLPAGTERTAGDTPREAAGDPPSASTPEAPAPTEGGPPGR